MLGTHPQIPIRSEHQAISRICLTPTRNESWIIAKFLAAAKTWADHVIVADQGSSDGTFQVAQDTEKVHAVINESTTFDEVYRQRLLLDGARAIPGKRLLIALDADEALSSNCLNSTEWDQLSSAEPGTMVRLRWVNILPGFNKAWIPAEPTAFGLIDDGSVHSGKRIHNPRLPWRSDAPCIDLKDIVVLHFQYVAWERMESKQRWYQAWEYTKHKEAGALDIFRQYNHMRGGWNNSELHPVRPEWIAGYERLGIDFRGLASEPLPWWDREVVKMLAEHGPNHFRKIAIWDKDWNGVARKVGLTDKDFSDPRSFFEKAAHRILTLTQKNRAALPFRAFERLLRSTGW